MSMSVIVLLLYYYLVNSAVFFLQYATCLMHSKLCAWLHSCWLAWNCVCTLNIEVHQGLYLWVCMLYCQLASSMHFVLCIYVNFLGSVKLHLANIMVSGCSLPSSALPVWTSTLVHYRSPVFYNMVTLSSIRCLL